MRTTPFSGAVIILSSGLWIGACSFAFPSASSNRNGHGANNLLTGQMISQATGCWGNRQIRKQQLASENGIVLGAVENGKGSESEKTSTTVEDDDDDDDLDSLNQQELLERNEKYIRGLLDNLTAALDKWIVNGSNVTRLRAYNIMKQIEREAKTEDLAAKGARMVTRAGMPLSEPRPISSPPKKKSEGNSSNSKAEYNGSTKDRKLDAHARKEWETFRKSAEGVTDQIEKSDKLHQRSALSSRLPPHMSSSSSASEKAKSFTSQMGAGGLDVVNFANDKKALQDTLESSFGESGTDDNGNDEDVSELVSIAAAKTSEMVARAGAGSAFEGNTLGIGGLDDVLSQVKRRIWVPLAAPPSLLKELGINPVRGLLLYGKPGCGKTLLARTLGKILSPSRPITVVSGPEIMDKFVGSSEANLREVFDNPPDLYPSFLTSDENANDIISRAALHIIVLDEFDAMARARGGSGGKGEQGDAGVARDSVVNQLLAKMDGVDGLGVPTLVIGLTNKRTLIEPALLRPGRFEVQIEVPPPRTVLQRVSILNVHMNNMFQAGRVLVGDAPDGTAASRRLERNGHDGILRYSELTHLLAVECDGMSGASLAGVCRAAASRALERAVSDFAGSIAGEKDDHGEGRSIADCLITQDDFEMAIEDVFQSSRGGDHSDDDDVEDAPEAKETTEEADE